MPNTSSILTGSTLAQALATTTTPIGLYLNDTRIRVLANEEVIPLLNDGRYQFIGRKSRVRLVRQIDPSAIIPIPWRPHLDLDSWRVSKACVLWPYVDD